MHPLKLRLIPPEKVRAALKDTNARTVNPDTETMKQLALTVNLVDNPDAISRYIEYHENIWPEVSKALIAVGIHQMRIWKKGRRLFMFIEVDDAFDVERDFARYLKLDPRCLEWEELMTTFQEPVAEANPGEKWTVMDEIFHLTEPR